mgnify:CR=1 FL=1
MIQLLYNYQANVYREMCDNMTRSAEKKWLLLIHQIPPKPNYFRVKIWRRLQQAGAIAIKQSVYVLPKNEQTYEDLNWIL